MKNRLIILLLVIISQICLSCSDKYLCECHENSQITMSQGTIEGLDIIPANSAYPHNETFRIVADNSSKTWDKITVKLYDDCETFLDSPDGVNFIGTKASIVYIDIPITSLTSEDNLKLGEIFYTCDFTLDNNSVRLSGSFGMISCEDFYDGFDADNCRWSCQLIYTGGIDHNCTQHLCPL